MKKRATIKDIARETGLSIATVSRVINKKKGHYNEETKNIVEKAIKKLKYKPHMGAINLKTQKTRTIGFVAPELDSFYNEVYLGSQDYAFKHKYSTFLFNTNYNKELEELQIENLLNRRVDGVMLASGLVNNKLVYKFLEDNVPVVSIENIKDDSNIPAVILDNYKYSKLAVKHLIDMAADRGAFIDQSQSLNLWVEDPDYNTLTSMHFYSWKKGLKTGIYYLRRKPKHQPQQFTIDPSLNKDQQEIEKAKLMCSLENKEDCDMCGA